MQLWSVLELFILHMRWYYVLSKFWSFSYMSQFPLADRKTLLYDLSLLICYFFHYDKLGPMQVILYNLLSTTFMFKIKYYNYVEWL